MERHDIRLIQTFQRSLFLRIPTLLIRKHNVYKQNETRYYRKGKCLRSRVGEERIGTN